MDVTLLYFEGCPSWKVADERLAALASERGDLRVTHHLVETPAEAERTGFRGSPSIQVDGVDLFAEPGDAVALACRRYPTPDGFQGAPTLDQLRAVLDVPREEAPHEADL
ncbi:thioredoxin family protein [uncultured Nocardioides sp.]|uniref:thioredoxin family protein n=1 Tax=uncultured Nocardioides sp. TaxID=198441 RepID=UPI0030F5F2E4